MKTKFLAVATIALGLVACGDDAGEQANNSESNNASTSTSANASTANAEVADRWALEPEEQRSGDPEAGYQYLIGGEYTGCGLPERVYSAVNQLGVLPDGEPAPVSQSDLPYFMSKFETENGETVVGPNCLTCHAGYVEDQLVIGAPGLEVDYGGLAETAQQFAALRDNVVQQLNLTDGEIAELDKFIARLEAVGPYVQAEVKYVANPADNLAAILFAHRDPETLAWSDEPRIEPPDPHVIPVDTPPWWRMSKKHAMLYNTAGRGDHAKIMMAASTLCVDTLEHAERINSNMGDVRAYISSIESPIYPWEVDQEKKARGEAVFNGNCAECHGTYGFNETYPNLVIAVDEVGTDSALADSAHFSPRFVEWFNTGFYGASARLEPQSGYIAPPLDGIWATAPFLHNGSVPTLEALLDSSKRPKYWRVNLGLDREKMGLPYDEVGAEVAGNSNVYDTTLLGYSNSGHTYGDELTAADRSDLIEYLKTL